MTGQRLDDQVNGVKYQLVFTSSGSVWGAQIVSYAADSRRYEADPSHTHTAEMKNAWSCNSNHPHLDIAVLNSVVNKVMLFNTLIPKRVLAMCYYQYTITAHTNFVYYDQGRPATCGRPG